jgi:nickel/cobalt transporter (NicO) family protein
MSFIKRSRSITTEYANRGEATVCRGGFLGLLVGLVISAAMGAPARAHDIPNQRVDRSIQVTIGSSRLEVDYEVSLSELTLTQDLRALNGTLAGGERSSWLALYADVTGPLNAKGLAVTVDGQPIALSGKAYKLVVEEHPRYTFHFEAAIPDQGKLSIRDHNFVSSEGTSRLGVRGRDGVKVIGDDLSGDVEQIPIRPVWQLSDEEERRTKQVDVRYSTTKTPADDVFVGRMGSERSSTGQSIDRQVRERDVGTTRPRRMTRITELLDDNRERSWVVLGLLALALGAAHAIQPGHGKTLVAAVALGPQARLYQPMLLGLATTLSHMGSVLLIALALWLTGATQVESVHAGLVRGAGFVIAAAGFWRIGRYVGGHEEHEVTEHPNVGMSHLEVLSLGVAGGLVPCWDAVGLVVLAAALGRLGEGVALVLAFSLGMAFVLVAVGCLAWKFKASVFGLDGAPKWQRRLGLACGCVLSAIGLYLFLGV